MKKFLKFVGAVILVGAAGIAALFYFTGGMVEVAEGFFIDARDGNLEGAYARTSAGFRDVATPEDLEDFLRNYQLLTFREASWSSRSIDGGTGRLNGTVTTADGTVPVTLDFVKEDDDWRIQHISSPARGLSSGGVSAAQQVPDESEQVRLVREATSVFAKSVQAGSMTGLYRHASDLWRQQTTVEELNEAFRAFLDAGLDLTVLDNYTPQFTEPAAVDSQGVLLITGFYPTEPQQFHFTQRFVREGQSWKLIGFRADIPPAQQ